MSTPDTRTAARAPVTRTQLLLPLALDLVVPVLSYLVAKALGADDLVALSVGGVVPVARIAWGAASGHGVDLLAVLVLFMVVAGVGLTFVTGDTRFALAKEALFTAAAGVWCLATLPTRHPMAVYTTRPFVTRGDAAADRAWDAAWERSARFRGAIRSLTLAWGLVFLLESVSRVAVAYTLPAAQAVVWMQVPVVVLVVAVVLFTKRVAGPRLKAELAAERTGE